jgi:hypothetical protein
MTPARPTPAREELGQCLLQARLAACMQPIDVFDAGLLPVDELLRYEAGSARAEPSTVYALCRFYAADRATTDHLASLAFRMTTFGVWLDMLTSGVVL